MSLSVGWQLSTPPVSQPLTRWPAADGGGRDTRVFHRCAQVYQEVGSGLRALRPETEIPLVAAIPRLDMDDAGEGDKALPCPIMPPLEKGSPTERALRELAAGARAVCQAYEHEFLP